MVRPRQQSVFSRHAAPSAPATPSAPDTPDTPATPASPGQDDRAPGAHFGAAPPEPQPGARARTPPPRSGPSRPAAPADFDDEEPPLRVALDVRTWGMSGLGTHVRELLRAMARLQAPVRWTLIGDPAIESELPDGLEVERFVAFDAPIYGARSFFGYPALPGVDLFHYPHYNLPLVRCRHKLVNVFDLFHLRYGTFGRRRYQQFFLNRLRLGHAHVVTACEKVAREVEQAARIPRERLTVLPLGAGRSRPAHRVTPPPAVESLTGTALRPPWMLALGIDQPHKNMDFLISALGLYFQRRPQAPPFVWLGLRPEGIERRVRQLPANLRQRMAMEPYSTAERMESLMAGAGVLIFPSLDEGFGFPPLEAMARGIPVLCARREPMTTILGEAPLYFEPSESASLWRMLDRLLDRPEVFQEVRQRGLELVEQYRWTTTARQLCRVYGQLAGRGATQQAAGGHPAPARGIASRGIY